MHIKAFERLKDQNVEWICLSRFLSGGLRQQRVDGCIRKLESTDSRCFHVGWCCCRDTPSFLGESSTELLAWDDTSNRLTCRGATFASAASAPERTSLGTTSLAANAIILDGITEGDVEMDLRMSRHARTLTALMRARLAMDSPPKQTIILGVLGPVDEAVESVLTDEVQSLFEATAAEANKEAEFEEMYEVVVIPIQSEADASNVSHMLPDSR